MTKDEKLKIIKENYNYYAERMGQLIMDGSQKFTEAEKIVFDEIKKRGTID